MPLTNARDQHTRCTPCPALPCPALRTAAQVDLKEAQEYAAENGLLHMETSAKDAQNVKTLFVEIAKRLPKAPPAPERDSFPIVAPKAPKRSCCG